MANYMPPKTPVSEAFLSRFNIEYLHGAIVKNVNAKTGMNIDRQSDGDLQALMVRVYDHAVENPYGDISSQVARMNTLVIQEATKTIQTGILQQLAYIDYVTSNPVPLAMPVSTSTYGNKMLANDKFAVPFQ
ncbi:hypothetical protein EBT25_02385 [bacterium]|jgi:hypothetical protein|nr:hypothetical protein [bacterium]